ncbi:hypothetical protein [Aliirhizobium smilacinae]|uniref:Helix-turn-helix domain-containing protein n=1 Tax=Aliirhizobium smilacinae TaxID=1395944 RepID=A0A5C4XUW8_9HYPH|nr:hypothetical protein [Rhizobium smilacinae]TNM66474.1 hypothetical protein FHP24_09830 [Rhizobium smilacinae]
MSTCIPVPMLPAEIITIKEAAYRAHVAEKKIRQWVREDGIGRQSGPGSSIQVSAVALEMKVCGATAALELLRQNQRESEDVRFYIDRVGASL